MSDSADILLIANYAELGALLAFPRNVTTLLMRTGVSYISADQACANAAAEIPDFDFASVESTARAAWNDLLGRIQITTDDRDADQMEKQSLLYSSVCIACCGFFYAELSKLISGFLMCSYTERTSVQQIVRTSTIGCVC
jgi:Glycosyl hydrolase family 92